MTKSAAVIGRRFHALDGAESGGSSGSYTVGASFRMQQSANQETFFVMDKHADAG
jgi:hypothetical protein